MPQVPTAPKEAKKLIPARYPPTAQNPSKISDEEQSAWVADMRKKRAERDAINARKTAIPKVPDAALIIKLEKYGRYFMVKAVRRGKPPLELTVAPTDIQSALGAIDANVGRLALEL